jgi:hypothetical protein
MSNFLFDNWIAGAETGLGFTTAKHAFYAVDLANAGPTPGAWNITASGGLISGVSELYQFTTAAPHGLAADEYIMVSGLKSSSVSVWDNNVFWSEVDYCTPTTPNGKKYKCVEDGQSGTNNSDEPTFPTTDGQYIADRQVVWLVDGSDEISPLNGLRQVYEVQSDTQFTILDQTTDTHSVDVSTGYFVPVNRTYLSEIADVDARYGPSDKLTGKVMLDGAIYDATNDPTLDLTGAAETQVVLLVETAALDDDVDLPDTQQKLVAYYDTIPGLPYAADSGVVMLSPSNTANRLLKL